MAVIDTTFHPGIFIMMKYPEVGKVKSRLAKSIGDEAATSLYRTFVQDTLTTVQSANIPFHIALYPPESQDEFARWLGRSLEYFPQEGTNLGERLQHGFSVMFKKEYRQVIALASDCPDLPSEILQTAASHLQTHKVVIGPAPDGGYYLIGFSSDLFVPDAFVGLSWGTESVFQETLARIELVTNQISILPEWQDIDTENDLRNFFEAYQLQSSNTLHTMKYLRNQPELLQILFS